MMSNKNGTALLFIVSFLVLIFLQGYYLYESYQLEEKALKKQVQNIANEVLDQLERYENEANEDALILSLKKLSSNQAYMNMKITEKRQWYAFKNFYESKVDSILAIETRNTGFKIALRSEIYSIFDEIGKKELLSESSPLVLFKTKAPISTGFVFNEGKWNSNFSEKDTELKVDENYHYTIRSRTLAELLNIKNLLIKKILPLSLVSFSIILLLIYVFWRTQKNLKLQQLKVWQLYTSIDSIAHELNTPLTTLKFTLTQTPAGETRDMLDRQIQRLEKVVSSIHSFSSDGEILTKPELQNFLDSLIKRFNQIKLNIDLDFEVNQKVLKSDFELILNNLIENSVKYKSNEVSVQLKFKDQIIIEVKDNGIGIDEDALPYIFDKYYRASIAENMQVNGLGLGLHLVKQTVDKYGGQIKVTSNVIKGAIFRINLANG